MKKVLALVALAGLLALSAAIFGSPPTKKEETVKKTEYAKIVKTTVTADTSAVAASDAEARTCEAAYAETLNESVKPTPAVYRYTAETRYGVSPPARFDKARAEGLSPTDYKNRPAEARQTRAVLKV